MSAPLEQLADVQHRLWATWLAHLLKMCVRQDDGSYVIPVGTAAWWLEYAGMAYSDLSEVAKEQERKDARVVLSVLGNPWKYVTREG